MSAAAGTHAMCTGRIWHVRQQPFRHAFDYGVHMFLLDLDRLDSAFAGHRLWSMDRFNLGSFRRDDHLGRGAVAPDADLAGRGRDLVEARLGFRPAGPVKLLANARYLGFGFNPVTFHFFHAVDGPPGALDAILLEVANTPWNERHVYALDCRDQQGTLNFEVAKDFHVSPFMPMDQRYRFRFTYDGERLEIVKQNWQDDSRVFAARMELALAPLTPAALTRALLSFPMTLKVVGGIYWQALRLWTRGATYHPRPAATEAVTTDT